MFFIRIISRLFLVVDDLISCNDPQKVIFFTNFLEIIPRALLGISTRNYPEKFLL